MSSTSTILSYKIRSSTASTTYSKWRWNLSQRGIKTLLTACGRRHHYLMQISKFLCWASRCNSSKRQFPTSSTKIKATVDSARWATQCSPFKRRQVSSLRVERRVDRQPHRPHLRYHLQRLHRPPWTLPSSDHSSISISKRVRRYRSHPIRATLNTSPSSSRSCQSGRRSL